MKKILPTIIIGLSLIACEKVIDVDLNTADPKTVVEAVITPDDNTHLMLLSSSGSFTDAEGIEGISGASASISDDMGNTATFTEVENGVYTIDNYLLSEGRTYDLTVTNGNEVIKATSTLGQRVSIDSVYIEESPFQGGGGPGGGHGGGPEETKYQVHVMFKDPVNETNFYRIRLFGLGRDHWSAEVGDDELYNGQNVDLLFFEDMVFAGDTIVVELWSMDRAAYDYYRTLEDIQQSNPFTSATPYNPISNLSSGLGHFAVYQRDTWFGVVEP